MSRKFILVLVMLALLTGGIIAQEDTEDLPTLRIGVLPVLNTIPLFVAQEQGFYVEEGVNVELINFASADLQRQAIEGGELDGVNTDLVRVIGRAASQSETKFVAVRHDAPADAPFFAIVANKDSGIENTDDLITALENGETQIAISNDSIIEYLSTVMLRGLGYEPDENTYTNIPAIPVRLELLNEGNVTTATLPEPLVQFTTTIQGNILLIDDSVTDFIPTVMAFDQTILDENPDAIRAFLRAYERAVELINENPEDFRDAPIQVPDPVRATYTVPNFVTAQVPTEDQVMPLVEWMLERELIEEAVEYEDIVNGAFLPETTAEEDTTSNDDSSD